MLQDMLDRKVWPILACHLHTMRYKTLFKVTEHRALGRKIIRK